MTLSLNEVEAMAKRAARGAGYPWGLAEEAGKATRWLCARGIDGCGALAGLVRQIDGTDIAGRLPRIGKPEWSGRDGVLCPLATGAALTDHAQAIAGQEVRLQAVSVPVFLVPFAAALAETYEKPMTVQSAGWTACTDGRHLWSAGAPPGSNAATRVVAGGETGLPTRLYQRANPNPDDWAVLQAFAHRTYAPATEESRRKGAGSDLPDTD